MRMMRKYNRSGQEPQSFFGLYSDPSREFITRDVVLPSSPDRWRSILESERVEEDMSVENNFDDLSVFRRPTYIFYLNNILTLNPKYFILNNR
jgi:hypothetical protein